MILMFIAGVGIPFMASMNAGLGTRLSNPVQAVFILSLTATFLSGFVLMIMGPAPLSMVSEVPFTYFLGGALFILYIFSITIATPRIGLGNAVFFVLLGQLIAAAYIDHYGILGAPISSISTKRMIGISLMVLGVYLARKDILPSPPI